MVNLNWNRKAGKGFFVKSESIDLDLGCLFELQDGYKGTVQALGESFGSYQSEPYITLDGDDRTGSVSTGENVRINGNYVREFKRILVYAFIYQGVANWAQADGVVTIKQPKGPDIVVNLDEHNSRKNMCAIALIENIDGNGLKVKRLVEYFSGHREMDKAYRWGLCWVAGSK